MHSGGALQAILNLRVVSHRQGSCIAGWGAPLTHWFDHGFPLTGGCLPQAGRIACVFQACGLIVISSAFVLMSKTEIHQTCKSSPSHA